MTKAEIEKKKSLARSLFLSGMEQTEIAEKVDVSRVTISKWCTADGWKEARAAKNVTRPELVNKLLLTIDTLITQVNESNVPALVAGLGDKLAKLSADSFKSFIFQKIHLLAKTGEYNCVLFYFQMDFERNRD